MPKTLQAKEIDLAKLEELFAIAQSSDADFFDEWRDNLPKLNETEQLSLDDPKADYLHLSKHSLLEPLVKMVVLAPILKLAGFYRDPFYLKAEQVVNILSQDQDILIQGRIDSEPQPDVAILKWQDDFYISGHPTPSDIHWLIEISDTTIGIGRRVKVPLYAESGIVETWLVNLNKDCLEVYRGSEELILTRGDRIASLAFPDVVFAVTDILG